MLMNDSRLLTDTVNDHLLTATIELNKALYPLLVNSIEHVQFITHILKLNGSTTHLTAIQAIPPLRIYDVSAIITDREDLSIFRYRAKDSRNPAISGTHVIIGTEHQIQMFFSVSPKNISNLIEHIKDKTEKSKVNLSDTNFDDIDKGNYHLPAWRATLHPNKQSLLLARSRNHTGTDQETITAQSNICNYLREIQVLSQGTHRQMYRTNMYNNKTLYGEKELKIAANTAYQQDWQQFFQDPYKEVGLYLSMKNRAYT